jgi:predicted AlkP superfamily phosphohydrolase/phosphomutase
MPRIPSAASLGPEALPARCRPFWRHLAVCAAAIVLLAEPAHAYIGAGAGFAIGTSLFAFFIAFISAISALLSWPFRLLIRMIRQRRALRRARAKRVVVLGMDGLEPKVVERLIAEGKLPNFAKLAQQGCYRRLGTTAPAMTPVAWSSYLTGCNPGKHNIFDFLTRDRNTYMPVLSSVHVGEPRRVLQLGKYRIPLGKADIRLHRKGKPFWNTLGEHGIFSNVIRMPITFPPEKFRGVLLSAMCVPDLRGSQGTFSYYSTAIDDGEHTGGEQHRVTRNNGVVRGDLLGPENTIVRGAGTMRCPFDVKITGPEAAVLKVNGDKYTLTKGAYSDWVQVKFHAGLGIKVRGICQFLLIEAEPDLKLYVTPIQIDPSSPAIQISHPKIYATYLSKLLGTYATMGLAEDTWGLNAKILDDQAFMDQVDQVDDERMRMFHDALDKVREGYIVCVVDGPDRVNHMFWRYHDPDHPAKDGQGGRERRNALEETYLRMDTFLGETLERCNDKNTVLMVMSDHGCASFRRGIDLNRWLEENGYLKLKPDGGRDKYLRGVDWSQTRAYAVGLTGIWINIAGRERDGIVPPEEAAALRTELIERLNGLKDPQHDAVAINRVFEAQRIYRGPYKDDAPDLIVGYNDGYRVSWEAAVGQPTEHVFHDNMKAWSGDHIIDPRLVPGVLFCNRKLREERPHITDLAPTTLDLFGVDVPSYMDGRTLAISDADGSFPDGDEPPTAERAEKSESSAEPVSA